MPVAPQRVEGGRDAAEGLSADGEADAARGGGAGASGGGAAGALLGVPGVAAADAGLVPPEVALGEGAHGEFGDENGAGGVEAFDDFCVFVEGLGLKAGGAPGGGVAFDGEEILAAPGDAVEGSAGFAGCGFGVHGGGLPEGTVFGEGDDEVKLGVEALEAGEVHLRERGGGDAFGADEFGELADGEEGEGFGVGVGRAVIGEGDFGCGADALGLLDGFEDHGAGDGIKDKGGCDGVGQGQLADDEDVVAGGVEAFEHEDFLFVGDGDACDGGGVIDHVGGDARRGVGVGGLAALGIGRGGGEGEQGSGEEGVAEAGGGGDGEEAAPGGVGEHRQLRGHAAMVQRSAGSGAAG